MRESGTLGDVVVIHLGTNGPFNSTMFDEAMESLEGVDRVIVLTVKVPRRWEDSANSVIAAGKERWPDVEILDWHAIGSANPEWFIDDQVHLNRTGMAAYAELLNRAINGDNP